MSIFRNENHPCWSVFCFEAVDVKQNSNLNRLFGPMLLAMTGLDLALTIQHMRHMFATAGGWLRQSGRRSVETVEEL